MCTPNGFESQKRCAFGFSDQLHFCSNVSLWRLCEWSFGQDYCANFRNKCTYVVSMQFKKTTDSSLKAGANDRSWVPFQSIFCYVQILLLHRWFCGQIRWVYLLNTVKFMCCRRYYFSLLLELSDISMPLIRAVIDKVSNAISFFLVCLIGRSLGLIYTGIRQSLRWKWLCKRDFLLFIEFLPIKRMWFWIFQIEVFNSFSRAIWGFPYIPINLRIWIKFEVGIIFGTMGIKWRPYSSLWELTENLRIM